jgi:hypothetical protein
VSTAPCQLPRQETLLAICSSLVLHCTTRQLSTLYRRFAEGLSTDTPEAHRDVSLVGLVGSSGWSAVGTMRPLATRWNTRIVAKSVTGSLELRQETEPPNSGLKRNPQMETWCEGAMDRQGG